MDRAESHTQDTLQPTHFHKPTELTWTGFMGKDPLQDIRRVIRLAKEA